MQKYYHYYTNLLGLFAICGLLIAAIAIQFVENEPACPLCLLQRMCFTAVGLTFALNLRLGINSANYGLIILSALLGLFISTRQILLHILPSEPGFGMAIFGLHLYTWAAITFILVIIYGAISLLIPIAPLKEGNQNKLVSFVIGLLLLITLTNLVITFGECAFFECPDNPTSYPYL